MMKKLKSGFKASDYKRFIKDTIPNNPDLKRWYQEYKNLGGKMAYSKIRKGKRKYQ